MISKIYEVINNRVFINDEKLNISEYLNDIIKYYNEIIESEDKINLIITMDKERIEAIMLVMIAVESFFTNLKYSTRTILDELDLGDIVIYRDETTKKKVRYEGIEKVHGRDMIVLSYEDKLKSRHFINLEDEYKLSIYHGESDKLSTMNVNKSVSNDSGKFLFGKLLKEDIEQFTGTIENQIIVVFPSKLYMNELISSIKIEIDNKRYDFTQVFPCKYYSDVDNGNDLKGNKLRCKELFVFSSRLDISKEVFRTNRDCTKLMLLGENTYRNYLGGVFDNLLSKKRLRKIFIHNTYDSINCVEHLLDQDTSVYSWHNEILEESFKSKDLIVDRVIESNINNIIVDDDLLNRAFVKVRKGLVKILKFNGELIDKEKFILLGFRLLNLLQKTVIPLNEYISFNKNKNWVENYFDKLAEIFQINKPYRTNHIILEPVINDIRILCNLVYNENPKINILKNNIENNSIIICDNEVEKKYIKSDDYLSKFETLTLKEFKKKIYINKTLVFTAFFNDLSVNQLPYGQCNNIKNLLYYVDIIKYNVKIKKLDDHLIKISNENKIANNVKHKNIKTIKYDETISYTKDLDISYDKKQIQINEEMDEELISNYINENVNEDEMLSLDIDINDLLYTKVGKYSYINEDDGTLGRVDAVKLIIFNENMYSYFTKNFKALCINSENQHFEKNIERLEIGDKVVFVNEKSEEDLFDLFHEIINSDIFRHKYSRDYNNMKYWKRVLKEYINKYDGDYDLVSQELKMYGLDKIGTSIRQWINDEKIIGPREKEAYKAIGMVTRDMYLLDNWESIYESCNIIRRFRTKFKKTFKSMVKMSLANKLNGANELEKLVIEVFGNLKEYADIVEVIEIQDIVEEESILKTNCLIKKNEDDIEGEYKYELVSARV